MDRIEYIRSDFARTSPTARLLSHDKYAKQHAIPLNHS